jgi:hypothetical protein
MTTHSVACMHGASAIYFNLYLNQILSNAREERNKIIGWNGSKLLNLMDVQSHFFNKHALAEAIYFTQNHLK